MSADASLRISNPPTGDELVATVACDVVEWPRLSQVIRLEWEAATHYYSCWKPLTGTELGIFYSSEAANRYADRNGCFVDRKPILRQGGGAR